MDWFLYDNDLSHERVKRQLHKMVKHTQIIRRQQPKNCLIVFEHIVGLELKGLKLYGCSYSRKHSLISNRCVLSM